MQKKKTDPCGKECGTQPGKTVWRWHPHSPPPTPRCGRGLNVNLQAMPIISKYSELHARFPAKCEIRITGRLQKPLRRKLPHSNLFYADENQTGRFLFSMRKKITGVLSSRQTQAEFNLHKCGVQIFIFMN